MVEPTNIGIDSEPLPGRDYFMQGLTADERLRFIALESLSNNSPIPYIDGAAISSVIADALNTIDSLEGLTAAERASLRRDIQALNAPGATHRNVAEVLSAIRRIVDTGRNHESATELMRQIQHAFYSEYEAIYNSLNERNRNAIDRTRGRLTSGRELTDQEKIDQIMDAAQVAGLPLTREQAEGLIGTPAFQDFMRTGHIDVDAMVAAMAITARESQDREAEIEHYEAIASDTSRPESEREEASERAGRLRQRNIMQGAPTVDAFITRASDNLPEIMRGLTPSVRDRIRAMGGPERAIEHGLEIYGGGSAMDARRAAALSGANTEEARNDRAAMDLVVRASAVVALEIQAERARQISRGATVSRIDTPEELVAEMKRTNPELANVPGGPGSPLYNIAETSIRDFNSNKEELTSADPQVRTRALRNTATQVSESVVEAARRGLAGAGQQMRERGTSTTEPEADARDSNFQTAGRLNGDARTEDEGTRRWRRNYDGVSTVEMEVEDAIRGNGNVRGAASGRNAQGWVQEFERLGIFTRNSSADNRISRINLMEWDDFCAWNDTNINRINTNTGNDLQGAQLGLQETLDALNLARFMSASEANRRLIDNNNNAGDALSQSALRNGMALVALADNGADGISATERAYAERLANLVNTNGGGISAQELETARRLDRILRNNNFMAEIRDGLAYMQRNGRDADLNNDGRVDAKDADLAARNLAAAGITNITSIDTGAEFQAALARSATAANARQ